VNRNAASRSVVCTTIPNASLATSPSPTASRNAARLGASGRESFFVNEDGRSTNANVGCASPAKAIVEHALQLRARAVAQHEHDAFSPRPALELLEHGDGAPVHANHRGEV
jgi:hypothetical protein